MRLGATVVLVCGVWIWRCLAAQPRPEPSPDRDRLEAAIAEIEAGRQTTPLIGEPTFEGEAPVTFLAKRDGDRVPRLVSDVTGWGERADGTFDFSAGTMTRVGRSEWYSLRAKVATRARIEYLIAYGRTDYRLDPHNPRRSEGPRLGGAQASEFVTAGYEPPPLAAPSVSPAGAIAEETFESRVLRAPRRLFVYTPPGHRPDGRYPVIVFLDPRAKQISRVLDSLIAQRSIPPVVAAFAGPEPSGRDVTGLRAFLTDELFPALASRYAGTTSARERAIVGISYGAKDALEAAFAPAGTIGNVALLIPGRRIADREIAAIANQRTPHLRVAILAGRYDQANVATARGVHRALISAGHDVHYLEVPEGHSASTWFNHLREMLVALFGSPSPLRPHPGLAVSLQSRVDDAATAGSTCVPSRSNSARR